MYSIPVTKKKTYANIQKKNKKKNKKIETIDFNLMERQSSHSARNKSVTPKPMTPMATMNSNTPNFNDEFNFNDTTNNNDSKYDKNNMYDLSLNTMNRYKFQIKQYKHQIEGLKLEINDLNNTNDKLSDEIVKLKSNNETLKKYEKLCNDYSHKIRELTFRYEASIDVILQKENIINHLKKQQQNN